MQVLIDLVIVIGFAVVIYMLYLALRSLGGGTDV